MKPGRVYLLRVTAPDGTLVPGLFRWTDKPEVASSYQSEWAQLGFTVDAIAATVTEIDPVELD